MPAWKWGGWAFALGAWGALVFLNVRCAFFVEAQPAVQFAAAAGLLIIDLAVIAFMVGVMEENAAGRPARALACFVLWVACSAGECLGAHSSLLDITGKATAPMALAEEQRKAAVADLDAEEANLKEIRRLLGAERREGKLDELHQRETASLKRIGQLRPKTFSAAVVPIHSWYVGLEAAVVGTLWLLSMTAVFGLTGRLHGTPSAKPVVLASPRRAGRLSDVEGAVLIGHQTASDRIGRTTRQMGFQTLPQEEANLLTEQGKALS